MEKANAIFMIVMGFLMVGGVIAFGIAVTLDARDTINWSREKTKELEARREALRKRKEVRNA